MNVAALAAGPPQADVTKSVQSELRRVGCLTGNADGNWSNSSQRSLSQFNRYAGTRLDTKVASVDTLDTIKLKSSRVCPLVCEHGFQADGDRCSKIVCAEGSFLNDDNECEKRRAKKPVATREQAGIAARSRRSKARSPVNQASLYHGFASPDGWCRHVVFGPAADRPGTCDGLSLVRRHHVRCVPLRRAAGLSTTDDLMPRDASGVSAREPGPHSTLHGVVFDILYPDPSAVPPKGICTASRS